MPRIPAPTLGAVKRIINPKTRRTAAGSSFTVAVLENEYSLLRLVPSVAVFPCLSDFLLLANAWPWAAWPSLAWVLWGALGTIVDPYPPRWDRSCMFAFFVPTQPPPLALATT